MKFAERVVIARRNAVDREKYMHSELYPRIGIASDLALSSQVIIPWFQRRTGLECLMTAI